MEGYGITDAYTKTEVDGKISAEENARKAADKDNLKVDGNGVISKVSNDGTTSSPVNKLVLKVDGDNQITMDEKGIKVGTNSTVIGSDGSIKGAAGKFTVDTNGLVTANGGVDTNSGGILTRGGNIIAGAGDISGKNISASGNLHADGDISGKDISGKDITGSGTVRGRVVTDGTASMEGGKVQGTSVSDGIATLSGGSLTGAVNITAGTITGNDVVVRGKLTTNGLETDRITLGSKPKNQTDIYQGNVTSKVNDTVSGVEYTAESIFNKDGSSITARTDVGEHADSTGKSIVGAKEISQYLGDAALPDDSKKNVTRSMVRNGDTFYMEDKAEDKTVDGKNKYSTVSQNAEERKVTVTDGTKTLTVTKNLTDGIVSETNGGAGKTVTLTQGMDGTYKVETDGTSTEKIGGQKIENYNGGLATNINGEETHYVSKTMTTTVDGQATEHFNGGLATNINGEETHYVSKTMTTTVDGQATENFNGGLNTNITGDENHTATGTITNTAQTVKTITKNNTVTSDKGGTTFKNEDAKTPFEEGDERGTKDNTKITGNKVETGKVLTDFAEVANNLDVRGSTTLGRDGNTTLTVNSESTFRDTVKMDKTLEVDGVSTFNNKVTITKNGLDVTGGTTTDTLTVTGTSEFADRADFRKDVYMWGNLEVTGETRTDTLYVDHDGYVGGNLNVDGNIETHDAVLSADSRQVVTGRQLYQTNERVDRLDNRIKKVGANAAALAALRPGDFNPDDKFSIAAGFGSYRNANAAALGLFYRPNENVLLSLGTSFGDGENMVNAGVSVKFGRGKSMAERRKEMADEVSSMRDEMRSQDERIAELEEMLKKQSELIEKLSKES